MPAIRTTKITPQVSDVAKTLVDTFVCDAAAVVGDLVRASLTLPGGVDVAGDHLLGQPVIGVIISKISTTSASVLLLGIINVTEILTQGKQVFLSPTGGFSSSPPVNTGHFQLLGVAIAPSKILFNPSLRIVKKAT